MGWVVVLLLVIVAVLLFGRGAVVGAAGAAAQWLGGVVVLAVVIAVAMTDSGKTAAGWALVLAFAAVVIALMVAMGRGLRDAVRARMAAELSDVGPPPAPVHAVIAPPPSPRHWPPAPPQIMVDAVEPPDADPDLVVVMDGLRERLALTYTDPRGVATERIVQVRRLTLFRGTPYVEGVCETRNAWRRFRLNRCREIVDVETGDVRSGEDLAAAITAGGSGLGSSRMP